MTYKFYDTCSLLKLAADLEIDESERIVISSVTLSELEHIKTATNKDAEVKAAARKLTRWLDEHDDAYDLVTYQNRFAEFILQQDLELNNDTKIVACAYEFKNDHIHDEVIFVTNDLCLKHLARLFFDKNAIEEVYDEAKSEIDAL